jgi:hypothetical protein
MLITFRGSGIFVTMSPFGTVSMGRIEGSVDSDASNAGELP